MEQPTMQPVEKREGQRLANFLIGIAFGLIILSLVGIYTKMNTNHSTGVQNNGYIRVTNCILSSPLQNGTRPVSLINECYTRVEHDLGIKLTRYNFND